MCPSRRGWEEIVKNLETVPVVALALGPTAGMGAARTVASHYSIMVKGLSQAVRRRPGGRGADRRGAVKEALGGSEIHTRNGVVDEEVASEDEAFAQLGRFLSYLPSMSASTPRAPPMHDPTDRRDEKLLIDRPARGQAGLFDAQMMIGVRQGSGFRNGQALGPRRDHRFCPARWLAGRGAGQRPDLSGRIMGGARPARR
jgi:acetyl-CoA carboxylase carboxyltransferase component